MALISFSDVADVRINTTSKSDFQTAVNGLEALGGTNWEHALKVASTINFGDTDPTYVIFVSDGNPTFRVTRGGYIILDYDSDVRYKYNVPPYNVEVFGYGIAMPWPWPDTVERCYDHAKDDAQTLANAIGSANFYTIGAFGDVGRMQQLAAHVNAQ